MKKLVCSILICVILDQFLTTEAYGNYYRVPVPYNVKRTSGPGNGPDSSSLVSSLDNFIHEVYETVRFLDVSGDRYRAEQLLRALKDIMPGLSGLGGGRKSLITDVFRLVGSVPERARWMISPPTTTTMRPPAQSKLTVIGGGGYMNQAPNPPFNPFNPTPFRKSFLENFGQNMFEKMSKGIYRIANILDYKPQAPQAPGKTFVVQQQPGYGK